MYVCVRARVRACVCARACVRACVHAVICIAVLYDNTLTFYNYKALKWKPKYDTKQKHLVVSNSFEIRSHQCLVLLRRLFSVV